MNPTHLVLALAVAGSGAVAFHAGTQVGALRVGPTPAVAATTTAAAESLYPAQLVRVIDGDTFEARVQVWPGIEVTTRVRLRGIDAPELSAACPVELALAEAAHAALDRMLTSGPIRIRAVTLDKFGGRVLAAVSAGSTADVATALLASAHARPYRGGRRESWCDGSPHKALASEVATGPREENASKQRTRAPAAIPSKQDRP